MKLDHSFLLGIVFACAAQVALAFLRGFLGAAWSDFRAWRQRRLRAKQGVIRWESIPDHFACRCTQNPDGYSVLDDTEETPT